MTTYYHAAPKSALEQIVKNGLMPAMRRWEFDSEAEAIEAFIQRWATRMGREIDAVDSFLAPIAAYDITRICVFESLDLARQWAAADPQEMVIFEINGEDYDFRPDNLAVEDEVGAWEPTDSIHPSDLTLIAS